MSSLEEIKKMLFADKFAQSIGITLDEMGDGTAVTSVSISKDHYNGVGIVQGGLIFTLADYAFAAAANSKGKVTVGVRCDIAYIKPVKEGKLTAIAEEVSCSNKISNYEVKIYNDKKELVAKFSGTGFRKEGSF
ncbi:MAG: hotdog fold thioesterase [Spirochaetaceae bacterium]|nr:hotdog fold thioesterase [Spirochaetaceae bacterium]